MGPLTTLKILKPVKCGACADVNLAMGRRKKRQQSTFSDEQGSCKWNNCYKDYCWSPLPNCCIKWPVKIIEVSDDKLLVYSHGDDAYFNVCRDKVSAFPDEDIKKKGIAMLTKKGMKATLEVLHNDLAWVLEMASDDQSAPRPKITLDDTVDDSVHDRQSAPDPKISSHDPQSMPDPEITSHDAVDGNHHDPQSAPDPEMTSHDTVDDSHDPKSAPDPEMSSYDPQSAPDPDITSHDMVDGSHNPQSAPDSEMTSHDTVDDSHHDPQSAPDPEMTSHDMVDDSHRDPQSAPDPEMTSHDTVDDSHHDPQSAPDPEMTSHDMVDDSHCDPQSAPDQEMTSHDTVDDSHRDPQSAPDPEMTSHDMVDDSHRDPQSAPDPEMTSHDTVDDSHLDPRSAPNPEMTSHDMVDDSHRDPQSTPNPEMTSHDKVDDSHHDPQSAPDPDLSSYDPQSVPDPEITSHDMVDGSHDPQSAPNPVMTSHDMVDDSHRDPQSAPDPEMTSHDTVDDSHRDPQSTPNPEMTSHDMVDDSHRDPQSTPNPEMTSHDKVDDSHHDPQSAPDPDLSSYDPQSAPDPEITSHDMVDGSHDPQSAPDPVMTSHDIVDDSHRDPQSAPDSEMTSHDTVDDSHRDPQSEPDPEMTSHDMVDDSHRDPQSAPDTEMTSHDTVDDGSHDPQSGPDPEMTPDVFGFDQMISSTPKYTETAIPVENSQNSSEEVVSASNSDDDDDGYMSEVWLDFSNFLDEESEVDNDSDEEYVPHKRRKKGKTCEVSSGSSSQDDTDSDEEYVPPKKRKKRKTDVVSSASSSHDDTDSDDENVPKKRRKGKTNVVSLGSSSQNDSDSVDSHPLQKSKQLTRNLKATNNKSDIPYSPINEHLKSLEQVDNNEDDDDKTRNLSENDTDEDEAEIKLPQSAIVRDKNVPAIFIRKIMKSTKTTSGKAKKTNRLQNARHACAFCKKLVMHIPSHMAYKHKNEERVREIQLLKLDEEKVKQKMAELKQSVLRADGNHLHNLKIVKKQKGELLVFRRPTENFNHKDYGPCPSCKDWMLLNSIKKHQKTCPVVLYGKEFRNHMSIPRRRELLLQTQVLLGEYEKTCSKVMKREVFSIMTPDDVSKIAKTDLLILNLGESWLRRCQDNTLKRKYYASQHMRHCAKLLIELRKVSKPDSSEKSVWHFLRPAYFDQLVHAALQTSLPDIDDEEELKSPSNAIKIKYDIMRMLHFKIATCMRKKDKCTKTEEKNSWDSARKEGEECKFLIEMEWGEKVTRLARSILVQRKIGVNVSLPKPEDIEKLGKYLVKQLGDEDLTVEKASWESYRHVAKLVECRLLMYNKRRSGEIEGIKVRDYLRQKTVSDIDKEMMGELSELDKYLLSSQALIETRGKGGRTVPVVIPKDAIKPMEYLALADVRKQAGVLASNAYLFANRGNSNILRVYSAMQEVSQKANLESPERITSVKMRKYMATLAQDEKSETDNSVLAAKAEDVKQDIQTDACEALVASKNESVEDKELPVSDFSEKQDSLSKLAEKYEEISSNEAKEISLAEELKSATDADTKLESVECAQEKTATNAVEINESFSSANVEEEVKAGLDEKHEQEPVPKADENNEAEADGGEHVTSESQGDVNEELTSGADKKDDSLPVIDVKLESSATVDLHEAEGGENRVSATEADKEKDLTSAENKEPEPTTTADESAALKEAESAPTAEADINKESSSGADTKEELVATKEEKSDSSEDADEKSKSASVSDESNATSSVPEEKPKAEEDFLDILGNGTLLKKVLEKGHGSRANMGDEIIIQVSQEIPELGKTFPEEQLQYVLGDGDVVQALDLAVALMEVGEKALVISGYKYMYGDLGLEPDIPPMSNFKLTIKLVTNNGPLDYPTMDFNTRFDEAKKKKERGNFLFKRKEFALALNSYTKASRILDPALGCVFSDESAENLQKLLEFRAIVLCNTSAAQFKLEAYDAAVKSASEATRLSPTYHKAYVRLGQAQEKLGNTDQTIKNYKLALKNDTENSKWVHGELERLTKLDKKSKQSQQEMYSKMFWGAKPPTVNGKTVTPEEAASLLFNQGASTSSAPDLDAEIVWQLVKGSVAWHLGSVLGVKAALGEMEQEEVDRIGSDFSSRLYNEGVPLTSAQLSAISKDLAKYVSADVCQLIEDRCRYLDNRNAILKSMGSPSDDLRKMPDLTAAKKSQPVSELVEKPVSRYQPHSGIMYYEGTDVDTGISTMSATPPNYVLEMKKALGSDAKPEPKKEEPKREEPKKKSSWMWKTGATLLGAGLVGLAGIGIYKYMNH